MHPSARMVTLVALAIATSSCTTDSPAESSSPTTSISLVAESPSTTVEVAPVDPVFIPLGAPARTDPVVGRWVKSTLGLDGLLVIPRDVIWDGTHFYLMQRVAFGDMRVWRSSDGVMWEELPSIGTFTMAEGGPEVLLSDGGRLVAGGRRGSQTAVWILDDSTQWTEVFLGSEARIRGLAHAGPNLVAFGTTTVSEDVIPERRARLWVSPDDGHSWTEVEDDRFGEYSEAVGVVSFGASAIAVANRSTPNEDGQLVRDIPLLLVSRDGYSWETLDIGLREIRLLGATGGDRIVLHERSGVFQSVDGESWTKILIDRSGEVGWFDERLVLTGGQIRPDDRFGEAMYPAAWIYGGNGVWHDFGSLDEWGEPGLIRDGVYGGGRFVAHGTEATDGSPDDGWVVYTFIAE